MTTKKGGRVSIGIKLEPGQPVSSTLRRFFPDFGKNKKPEEEKTEDKPEISPPATAAYPTDPSGTPEVAAQDKDGKGASGKGQKQQRPTISKVIKTCNKSSQTLSFISNSQRV